MNLELNNKQVLITGASRGIGRTVKQAFLDEGAIVYAPTRDELDLNSEDSINGFLDHLSIEPDIFIHCAGVNILSEIEAMNLGLLEQVMRVNSFSATLIIGRLASIMKKKGGHIVLVSSLYASVSREFRAAYSMSKNAITGLVKTMTLELSPYNIMINALAPGYVMTDMTRKNLSNDEIQKIETLIPTGRFQTEEEIADAVMFLCSARNKSITGQLITVDGGFLCR